MDPQQWAALGVGGVIALYVIRLWYQDTKNHQSELKSRDDNFKETMKAIKAAHLAEIEAWRQQVTALKEQHQLDIERVVKRYEEKTVNVTAALDKVAGILNTVVSTMDSIERLDNLEARLKELIRDEQKRRSS